MKGNIVYPLSKPLADAIIEAKIHDACKREIDILKGLCTTGATLESLSTDKRAPFWAYWYACDVIKSRWLEAEPIIMTSPEWSYRYAHNVIKGRWLEGEEIIMSDPKFSYWYALDVIKGRWPEAEATIMTSPELAYWYQSVLKTKNTIQ